MPVYKSLKTIYHNLSPAGSKRHQWTYKFIQGILINFRPLNVHYRQWVCHYDILTEQKKEEVQHSIQSMANPPRFSVIMPVYDPSLQFLSEAIESVLAQYYPHWELCISDDASTEPGVRELIQRYAHKDSRIRYVFREENGHISAASNSALDLATGDFIALLDHDDRLHPMALFEAAQVILKHPDSEIIYSDEDKITKHGKRFNPYFKPDFDDELLLSHNMVSHLGIYRLETIRKMGGFQLGLEGSQDYDLLLRVLEQIRPDQIHHIPWVLYHWRSSPQSVAENINIKPYAIRAGERALNEHLARKGIKGEITFRADISAYQVSYEIPKPHPTAQIILISTPDGLNVAAIQTLLAHASYEPVSIIVGLFGEGAPSRFDSLQADSRISFVILDPKDGIARCFNSIIASSQADFIGLLNGSFIEFSSGWLETLMAQAIQDGIGAVGPKLLSFNGLVYSNGVILGDEDIATHLYKGKPQDYAGYFGWGQLQRGFSVLSGECLLVKRVNYSAVGGLNERLTPRKFIWTDFCLKLKELGLRNIVCPSVRLRLARSIGNVSNIEVDRKYMLEKWEDWITHDPAFNPNLTISNGKIDINI